MNAAHAPAHVADTYPYPWPYHGRFVAGRTALLLAGAQDQLVAASDGAAGVLETALATAAAVRAAGGRVVWLRHGAKRPARRVGRAFLPERHSDGWFPVVAPEPDDLVVECAGWDGCFGSDLDNVLRDHDLETIVLGGFASEITVDSTVRRLNDQGYECLVLTDCCAPLDARLGARAHASLTMSGGIFGALGTSAALLAALRATATPNSSPVTASLSKENL